MKRGRIAAVCALALALACAPLYSGCGDDTDTTKKDAGSKQDGGADQGGDQGKVDVGTQLDKGPTPDTLKPDLGVSKLGEGCSSNQDCGGKMFCLIYTGLFGITPGAGICSQKCTPDSSSTPLVDEDDCPTGFMCATFTFSSGKENYCLKKCTPSLTTNSCPKTSKQTCHPRSVQWSGGKGQALCIWPACTTDKDCPVLSATACTSDSQCTSLGTGAFCSTDNKLCALPGKCSAGGLCGPHTQGKTGAKVGDPCKSDLDCPNAGTCLTEQANSSSAVGVDYRNGYCTIPFCSHATAFGAFSCPTGSTCHRLYYGGLCFKTCDMTKASECRGYAGDKGGDYECYAWNNLQVSSQNVTDKPVCQSAPGISCDFLGTTSLDCSSLGLSGNTTNMSCRDRYTGAKKSSKYDTTGICLDDTASGTFQTTDAGTTPADAGVNPG